MVLTNLKINQLEKNNPLIAESGTNSGSVVAIVVPSELRGVEEVDYYNIQEVGETILLGGLVKEDIKEFFNLIIKNHFDFQLSSFSVVEEDGYSFFSNNPQFEGEYMIEFKRLKRKKLSQFSSKYLFKVKEDEVYE